MRGLDSNILIRYLTADDDRQTAAARALLEEGEEQGQRFHINTTVLCEVVWTLRSRPYSLGRPDIASAIEHLAATPLFVLQSRELVLKALQGYRQGRADFSDYLIGWLDRQAGCKDTVTFDRKLAREKGFTLLD